MFNKTSSNLRTAGTSGGSYGAAVFVFEVYRLVWVACWPQVTSLLKWQAQIRLSEVHELGVQSKGLGKAAASSQHEKGIGLVRGVMTAVAVCSAFGCDPQLGAKLQLHTAFRM